MTSDPPTIVCASSALSIGALLLYFWCDLVLLFAGSCAILSPMDTHMLAGPEGPVKKKRKTSDKNKLTEAVKALRLGLGDTQQSFAARLGTAIRTCSRWETVRAPSGAALAKLERTAATNGLTELRMIFSQALAGELGEWDTADFKLRLDPENDTERLFIAALLSTLRHVEYSDQRARLIPLLRKQAQAVVKNFEQQQISIRLTKEADRLLDLGIEPAAIAKALKVTEADVQNRVAMRNLARVLQEAFPKEEKSK